MSKEAYAVPNALVSPDWLAAHIDDPGIRVVEVDVSPKSYDEGHIQGAVFWDIYQALKDASYRLVDDAIFERLLSRSGITPDSKIVFYGYGPALGYWLMKRYRHSDCAILNLCKQRWHEDGRPWSTERIDPQATTRYALAAPDNAIRAIQPEVAAAMDAPDRAILDVRSEGEFRGERFWPSGAPANNGRPGRIPGARNVVLDAVLNADGSYASPDVLRRTFPAALDDVPELITYCTIGNRASVAWFVLSELLGRDGVRVYDGSWAEWGFMPEVPVDTGA